MPQLDKRLFRGPSDFDPDKLAKGRVRNFTSDIGDRLKEFGWNGTTKGCNLGLSMPTKSGWEPKVG